MLTRATKLSSAALLSAALAAIAAPSALADDTKPRIDAVVHSGAGVPVTPPGGVLEIAGRGFPNAVMGGIEAPPPPKEGEAAPPGQPAPRPQLGPPKGPKVISARLGAREAQILMAEYGMVRVMVPHDMKPGKYDLQLVVQKEKTNKVPVEVMELEKWKEAYGSREGESNTTLETHFNRWKGRLRIEKFEFTDDAESKPIAKIDGYAEFPDRTFVILQLKLTKKSESDARQIESAKVGVKDGRFTHVFGPFDKGFLAGLYSVEATVDLGKNPHVRRQIAKTITEGEKKVVPGWKKQKLVTRDFQEVGARADRDAQEKKIKRHYWDALAVLRNLLEELDVAYGSTAKSLFKKGSEFEDIPWQQHLAKHGLLRRNPKDPTRYDDKWTEKLRGDKRFVTRNYHFDPDKYLDWVVGEQLPAIQALKRVHAEYKSQFVAVRYPDASLKLEHMLSVLYSMTQKQSAEFWTHNELEIPKELRTPGEMAPLPGAPDRRYIAQAYGEIVRIVGLKDFDPNAEEGGEGEGEGEDAGK